MRPNSRMLLAALLVLSVDASPFTFLPASGKSSNRATGDGAAGSSSRHGSNAPGSGRWTAAFNHHGLDFPSLHSDSIESSTTRPQGWLSRWLAIGGEGEVVLHLGHDTNITLPHRPAAFPSQLFPPFTLPLSGFLQPYTALEDAATSSSDSDSASDAEGEVDADTVYSEWPTPKTTIRRSPSPIQACTYYHGDRHKVQDTIALVERGGCDFARKVRAAQALGAAGVIVGDGVAREGETVAEGRTRENLITMFSPEDTYDVFIPSVFVSRASYLFLMDLFANQTMHGQKEGVRIEISEGSDEGGALSSLLSFALLMPSLFLLATIAVHRIRVARQREADRAPPLLVLSLPERIWTPDIIWEKDSDSESNPSSPNTPTPHTASRRPFQHTQASSRSINTGILPPPPPISPAEVGTPPPDSMDNLASSRPKTSFASSSRASGSTRKPRTKSAVSAKKYFSKDECAICMDSFQRGEIVRILPCGHVFHKDECDEWLMKWRKLCPTCRADVTLPPGGPVDGTTITPVAHPALEGIAEEPPRSFAMRISDTLGRYRTALFGRRVQLDEEVSGERTPLVNRSPARSPRASRSNGADRQV